MTGKSKARVIVFISLLIAIMVLAPNLIYTKSELNKALQEVERLKEENNALRSDFNRLKGENEQLKLQLGKLKLQNLEEKTGLIRVEDIDDSIAIDLRYATENNFTGQKLYPAAVCILQKSTAEKLKKASDRFKEDGYRIKIWDAYRPLEVQKKLWELFPDRRYVANPLYGSKHNRGGAVDVTLVDKTGNELEMPTDFDHFSEKAWRNYEGNTEEAQRNMEYLGSIMEENGFTPNSTEWWHFDDNEWRRYTVLNIKLEEFIISY